MENEGVALDEERVWLGQIDEVTADPAVLLATAVAEQAREHAAVAGLMAAVVAYAAAHRVEDPWDGAIDPGLRSEVLESDLDAVEGVLAAGLAARPGSGAPGQDPALGADPVLGREAALRLAGEGAFVVAEFAVTELAAALGMTEAAARAFVGQSMEVHDRLPRLWERVQSGVVPGWKARLVAKQTIALCPAAAAQVDAQLAGCAHRLSPWRIAKTVEAAILRHDPNLAAARAAAAAERRGVWIEDHLDGLSDLRALADTPDAAAFEAALEAVATTLGRLGDPDSRDARRAKALGVLADPQYALDLHATATAQAAARGAAQAAGTAAGTAMAGPASPAESAEAAGSNHHPGPRRVRPLTRAALHVHLHIDAVTGVLPAGEAGVARVEGYGPRAAETIRRWLGGVASGVPITVTPVVDLAEQIAADAYEAPERLRAQIEHRDLHCRFPFCGAAGRSDLDHIQEYRDPVHGGGPGQTSTRNLARLCRYHHRVKTRPGDHGRWDYHRNPDDTLTWTSPLGRTYIVDHTGTRPG